MTTGDIDPGDRRYDRASIILHWTIAALILIQIGLGWTMNEVMPDHSPAQAAILPVHISVGLTILLLVLVRIGFRLTHRAPALPPGIALWERLLARASQLVFYVLMLAMPLTGWALVLPAMGVLFGSPAPRPVRHELSHIHVYILIWIVLINLALHVAGALKHQFDGSPVLWKMTWARRPAAPGER
jgi:cytochrome b561